MYDFKPQYIHHREKEIERQRKEQRIAFALRNQPDTSKSIANDSVTFQKNHYTIIRLLQILRGCVAGQHRCLYPMLSDRPESAPE